jgi:hypothetical protein
MMEECGGVKKLLKDKFPTIILWLCANHRLELSVHGAVETLTGVNRFKHFIDELYVLHHATPKNARELKVCAATLDVVIENWQNFKHTLGRIQF